jgi:flagellum-specific peptidoglycan hydrolase FlgJ
MASAEQLEFLQDMVVAATEANHIYPQAAAAEAALESSWGTSELYLKANNVFGSKQPVHPLYPSISLETPEFIKGEWVKVLAEFELFPDVPSSFRARMATLVRLAGLYPAYGAALKAPNARQYILDVSARWSTDPKRGQKVTRIYDAHFE